MRKITKNYSVFFELVLAFILSAFSFYLFIELQQMVFQKQFVVFDEGIMSLFYLHRAPFLTSIMLALSSFGKEGTIGVGILLTIALYLKKYKKEALVFAFITSLAPVISSFLKIIIQRPRPVFHSLVSMVNYDFSFPSGHAMGSFVFYLMVSYLIFHFFKNKKIRIVSFIFSAILILLIGLSRIYLGVHYPSDILAGYLAGLCWLGTNLTISKILSFYKLLKENQ